MIVISRTISAKVSDYFKNYYAVHSVVFTRPNNPAFASTTRSKSQLVVKHVPADVSITGKITVIKIV